MNDVHGRHRQTGTVNEATNVTTDVDVIKIKLFGDCLLGVILSLIFRVEEFLLSEARVTINSNFAVSCHYDTLLCQDEGVDFDHVAVLVIEALV